MAVKKLDYAGLQTLISCIKTYVDNRSDSTAEQRYRDAMREFFEQRGAENAAPAQLTAICDEWYAVSRNDWDGYTRFYHPDKSQISEGTRGGDASGLTCKASTDSDPGQDDFAGNALFAPTDCNWVMDSEGEPQITAIDGIKCAQDFVRNDPDYYVGVLQMTGYHWWTELSDDSDYYYEGYSAKKKEAYVHIEPLPESVINTGATVTGRILLEATTAGGGVAQDNGGISAAGCNVRTWVLHSKYMSDLVDGTTEGSSLTAKMTSYSGGPSLTYYFSHNTSHTFADNTSVAHGQTKTYSGATITDNAFLILMARIKYASLTMDGIIQGCVNYSFQHNVAVSQTNKQYVLVTTAQANNVLVGSTMLIGRYNNGIDRFTATTYEISTNRGYVVTKKDTEVVDSVTYGRIWFENDPAFSSVASGANVNGTTYISSFVWRTGSCDNVKGNDGSPTNPTNGREPAKLQGIEYMMGAYEVFADVILNLYKDPDGDTYYYQPYIVRSVSMQATSITNNYVASGLIIQQPAAASWNYIKYMGYKNGLYFALQVGGSSTTYTRDAIYMESNSISTRSWLSYGTLGTGVGHGGLSSLDGDGWLGYLGWYLATRLSCNGNRGVYIAA